MDPIFRSSGNLIADRRFVWAQGALEDGDFAGAADLAEQVLELAPDWPPAWLALGYARRALGEAEAARAAFEAALRHDAGDSLGASLRLAQMGAAPAPARAPDDYVRDLFDQYAQRFDKHLVEDLAYRGPELLRASVERACAAQRRAFHFRQVFDLGCGTGLMGLALWPHFDAIHGVDLAPKMVQQALATGKYGHAEAGEIGAFLAARDAQEADLIIAADVFVYLGDLDAIFRESARVLTAGGLFAFSVQRLDDGAWQLGPDMRYAHSGAYLRELAGVHGLKMVSLEEASTRQDGGIDVPGLVAVLAKP